MIISEITYATVFTIKAILYFIKFNINKEIKGKNTREFHIKIYLKSNEISNSFIFNFDNINIYLKQINANNITYTKYHD